MDKSKTAILERAFNAGHFMSPGALESGGVFRFEDVAKVDPDSEVATAALRSLSESESIVYSEATQAAHGRSPDYDGKIGPAMMAMAQVSRCSVPDIAPPPGSKFAFGDPLIQAVAEKMQRNVARAQGPGNWPGCHAVGNFHACAVEVQTRAAPDFLRPMLVSILGDVREAYAAIGLRFDFYDRDGRPLHSNGPLRGSVNIRFNFVDRSSGWIGLAIVGKNETCSSQIWCRYLKTYRGGRNPQSIRTQWTTLIKHELGHNCGLDHTRGGVMNPTIVNGLGTSWGNDDPSTRTLRRQFGGEAVPIGRDPIPDDGLKKQIERLKAQNRELRADVDRLEASVLAQRGVNQWLVSEIQDLKR